MGLLLDVVYLGVAIVASPWIAYRLTRTRAWPTLPRRLGAGLGAEPTGCIWLHASSVGEVALLKPLVPLLERAHPGQRIVVSTFTRTGHEAARAGFPAHRVIYFPLDLSLVVAYFMARLDPRLVVIVESELWPNFLRAALRHGAGIAVLNGKMSPRSYRVHRRMRLVPRSLGQAALVAAQNAANAERFAALGVPRERLFVTGNMKYDLAGTAAGPKTRSALRSALGYGPGDVVVIGGSLHPGEAGALLDAHARVASEGLAAALILVPRYPEHARSVAEQARRHGRPVVLQTDVDTARAEPPGAPGVLVVDVIGRLGRLYAAADIAFVGGSLYYRGAGKGGHNLMEPAVLGVPVVFGPYNVSFQDTVEDLLDEGAAACVTNVDELVATLRQWISEPAVRASTGKRGKDVIERGQGATARNFDLLLELTCVGEPRLQRSTDPSTMPPAAGDSDIR